MQFIKKYEQGMNALNRCCFWAMSIILIFMSGMLFVDVVCRYVFSYQTSFGYDLNLWLTIVMAFLGGGYAIQTEEHIVVDVLYERFGNRMKTIVNIFYGIFALILASVLIIYGGEQVLVYCKRGAIAMSGFNIHMWIKWLVVPIGGICLALQAILYEIENIYFLCTGKKVSETYFEDILVVEQNGEKEEM